MSPPRPRLYFANDCSDYHGGSWAVAEVIRREARAAGWQVVPEKTRTTIEKDVLTGCDGVLVNGEGTLHRDKPRARHLMALLAFAQRQGLATALVNASWSRMGPDHVDTLCALDVLDMREPESAARIEAETGLRPPVYPDLSRQHPLSRPRGGRRKGMLVSDFYCAEFDAFVTLNGGPLAREPQLHMRSIDWKRTLKRVAGAELFVTGRFHGLLAALSTRTPFVAWAGNTDKVDAVLSWLGAGECLARTPDHLPVLAREWRDRSALYEAVFDRFEAMPAWRLTLRPPSADTRAAPARRAAHSA